MKKRMWALAFCWIALLGMLFQWVQPVWADTKYPEGPQVYAEGYFVIDGDTGEVLATKNKGQIMKAVMGELKGKADGKVINQVVGELCK